MSLIKTQRENLLQNDGSVGTFEQRFFSVSKDLIIKIYEIN